MEITIISKLKLNTDEKIDGMFSRTAHAYFSACNDVERVANFRIAVFFLGNAPICSVRKIQGIILAFRELTATVISIFIYDRDAFNNRLVGYGRQCSRDLNGDEQEHYCNKDKIADKH